MDLTKNEDLQPPKIDLELCTRDNNIAPIDKVFAMDEDSFEKFTIEWLYGYRKSQYKKIVRIGGAGDKGRDIIGYYQDGSCDYYQCKHYDVQLSPSVFDVEFGKLCYYTWIKEITIPKKYYIVGSHNIGPKLLDLINDSKKLKDELITTWDTHCKKGITDKKDIPLSNDLRNYILNFDFSIVEHIPIEEIIDEHITTIYGKIRFGGSRLSLPNKLLPGKNIKKMELPYINALLEMYSEYAKKNYEDVNSLQTNETLYADLQDQRDYFYSAETIRRFVRDTFTNEKDFVCLEEEIYEGIKEIHEEDYENGFKRLKKDLAQAVTIQTTKSLLDSQLNIIGAKEKKGICHMLVEDKNIRWVKVK